MVSYSGQRGDVAAAADLGEELLEQPTSTAAQPVLPGSASSWRPTRPSPSRTGRHRARTRSPSSPGRGRSCRASPGTPREDDLHQLLDRPGPWTWPRDADVGAAGEHRGGLAVVARQHVGAEGGGGERGVTVFLPSASTVWSVSFGRRTGSSPWRRSGHGRHSCRCPAAAPDPSATLASRYRRLVFQMIGSTPIWPGDGAASC